MAFSLKKTIVGTVITGGALFLLHDRIESIADDHLDRAWEMQQCASDLGRTGCADLILNNEIKAEVHAQGNTITYSYSKSVILDKAKDMRNDANDDISNIIALGSLGVMGVGITVISQLPQRLRPLQW